MIVSVARTAIRASTDHDSDTQVTDAQLTAWLDLEYKNLRRVLAQIAPSLYATADSSQVIAAGSTTLALPTNYERLVRLEQQFGSNWFPVLISDELTPHYGELNAREEGAAFQLSPVSLAPGTYRFIYVALPATLVNVTDDSTALAVPSGCEDVILERVAARVRERFDEDPSAHLARADRVWREQKSALRRRYGKHAVPGLRPVRRW